MNRCLPLGFVVALLLSAPAARAAEHDFTVPGPYSVGMTTLRFVKASETTGEPRQLDTLVWYPAVPGSGTGGGEVAVDADVRDGRWPLIMFSHGSCGFPGQSPFYTEALASWGFVVAAPPHPGNTTAEIPRCFDADAELDSFANRVADIEFVLNGLIDGTGVASPFAGRIDSSKLGMSGHSFGGQTTLRVAAADRRIKGAVALAPSAGGIANLRIASPTMVLVGERDSLTPVATDARGAFALLRGPRFLVELERTGHCAFTVVCTPIFCGDGCEGDTISLDDAHDLTLRLAIPFFLRYVAGRGEFARDLPPAASVDGTVVLDASPTPRGIAPPRLHRFGNR